MAETRELKRRIRSVENTRQITRTMEMVSTSKLKRAQDRVIAARPYAAALHEVIADLYNPDLADRFPLFRRPKTIKRAAVVLITSNRGLCGAFNSNLIKTAARRIAEFEESGAAVELHAIGKKGIGYFRYLGRQPVTARQDIGDRPAPEHAGELVEPLMDGFAAGKLDHVEVVFAKFVTPLSTPPTVMQVLPVEIAADGASGGANLNYILAPSADEIVRQVLPLYVRNAFYRALVETAASEHGARRTAMKNATDNAGEILDNLRRTYNRARQAQITQEIAEIVGGADALKG